MDINNLKGLRRSREGVPMISYEYVGVAVVLFIMNIGLAAVTIHYRRKYEEIKNEYE